MLETGSSGSVGAPLDKPGGAAWDPYVLQTGASNMRLMWANPTTQTLENAVLANTGNSRPHFKLGAFDPKTDFTSERTELIRSIIPCGQCLIIS
jgi:hypothetical protein